MTFAEEFCRVHELEPEQFEAEILKRALYPAARLLRPVLALDRDYFTPDLDFIRGVGRMRHPDAFTIEARDFAHHPENRGFRRETLRLRVSARRLRDLVEATFNSRHRPP